MDDKTKNCKEPVYGYRKHENLRSNANQSKIRYRAKLKLPCLLPK